MDKDKIFQKFGNKEYQVNENTFIMGIHHLLGEHIAKRFEGYNTILDTCCGAGFMSIALARYVNQVIIVDINQNHLEQANNNVKLADVFNKVEFILGDILGKYVLNKISKIDGAFLDPDWAEVGNSKHTHISRLSDMQPSANELFNAVSQMTENVILRLPREMDLSELKHLPPHKLEKVYLDNDFKFYCVYFGELRERVGDTELRVSTK